MMRVGGLLLSVRVWLGGCWFLGALCCICWVLACSCVCWLFIEVVWIVAFCVVVLIVVCLLWLVV